MQTNDHCNIPVRDTTLPAIGSAQMHIKKTVLFPTHSRATETVKAGGAAQDNMETILVRRMQGQFQSL